MNENQIREIVQSELIKSQYRVGGVPVHYHNGIDSPSLNIPESKQISINGLSTGTQPNFSSGSTVTIQFTGNSFANGITWNSGSYAFIVVTAGQYLMTTNVNFGSAPASGTFYLEIDANGSGIASDRVTVSNTVTAVCQVTTLANLSIGDIITAKMSQNTGFTVSPSSGYLGIALI